MQSWTVTTNALAGAPSIVFGRGRFMFLRYQLSGSVPYAVLYESPDGMNWSEKGRCPGPFVSGVPTHLLYANGTYLAYGASPLIFSSSDGVSWVSHDTGMSGGGFNGFSGAWFWRGSFLLTTSGRGNPYQIMSGVIAPGWDATRLVPEFCRQLPDGAMLLTTEAPYGRAVTVEASEDLATWTAVATDSCDTGEFEVYDEAAKTLNRRFYRAWQAGP
jgi:hypothetical protein